MCPRKRVCNVKQMGTSEIYFCLMPNEAIRNCLHVARCSGLIDIFCEHPERGTFHQVA